jgi:hypothetical protein
MARCIDLLAGTRNTPAAIAGLHPGHDSCQIFADGQISEPTGRSGNTVVLPLKRTAVPITVGSKDSYNEPRSKPRFAGLTATAVTI